MIFLSVSHKIILKTGFFFQKKWKIFKNWNLRNNKVCVCSSWRRRWKKISEKEKTLNYYYFHIYTQNISYWVSEKKQNWKRKPVWILIIFFFQSVLCTWIVVVVLLGWWWLGKNSFPEISLTLQAPATTFPVENAWISWMVFCCCCGLFCKDGGPISYLVSTWNSLLLCSCCCINSVLFLCFKDLWTLSLCKVWNDWPHCSQVINLSVGVEILCAFFWYQMPI